ncbi:MAG: M48 family metallopeptidase [Endomicrobium sp.]|jgi:predicted metal-dependent hydrolase|nr:M48 family metallopeptidase [Endomicrobium sp.]
MKTLTIDNIQIEVQWKKVKNMRLSISAPEGRVRISAPFWVSEEAVSAFIVSKMDWIKKKIDIICNQPKSVKLEYISGEKHYFKGIPHTMRVIIRKGAPAIEADNSNFINLYIRDGLGAQQRENILHKWYRRELEIVLSPLIAKWETLLNVKTNYWKIKRMKTLWGSCNVQHGRILFNLELIKKPLHCIEYVIVHELTHLLERRHNAHFKSLLDLHFPTWRQIKKELNGNTRFLPL